MLIVTMIFMTEEVHMMQKMTWACLSDWKIWKFITCLLHHTTRQHNKHKDTITLTKHKEGQIHSVHEEEVDKFITCPLHHTTYKTAFPCAGKQKTDGNRSQMIENNFPLRHPSLGVGNHFSGHKECGVPTCLRIWMKIKLWFRKKYVLASFIGSEHDRLVTKGMSNAQIFKVTRPQAIWGGFDHIPIRSVGQHSRHFRHINRLSSQSEASQLSFKIGYILRLQLQWWCHQMMINNSGNI